MPETKVCECYVILKTLLETQRSICWPIAPQGKTVESVAVTRTKHQVSNTRVSGRESILKLHAASTNSPSSTKEDYQRRVHGRYTNANQQFILDSLAWWWSHIRPHTLQEILSCGFLVRKKSPLQDRNR